MEIVIRNCQRKVKVNPEAVRRAVEETLKFMGKETLGEVSVLLTDNRRIRKLNKKFRGVDEPTDVLAFPLGEEGFNSFQPPLGDIAISVEMAEAQARQYGHSLMKELSLLAIHGALHLLGEDDLTGETRKRMRERESLILKKLGL